MFAFIVELILLAEDKFSNPEWHQTNTFLVDVIGSVAKPFYFSEQINQNYFDMMWAMLERSPRMFSSSAGQEFFLTFACAPNMAKFEKQVKRLLVSYK